MADWQLAVHRVSNATTFQDRITGMAWHDDVLWYARGDRRRIGRFLPASGSYREFEILAPSGVALAFDALAVFPTVGRRPARLGACAPGLGLLVFDERPLAAQLFRVGAPVTTPGPGETPPLVPTIELQISTRVIAIAPDGGPWLTALARPANAPLSTGSKPSICRFERDFAGQTVVRSWQLPQDASSARSIWFDALSRPWMAFGQGNAMVPVRHMFGVMLYPAPEMACFSASQYPTNDYDSLAGHDASGTVRANLPSDASVLSCRDIHGPFPASGGMRTIDACRPPAPVKLLTGDGTGDTWYVTSLDGSPSAIGVMRPDTPIEWKRNLPYVHETLRSSLNAADALKLKVREVASGRASIERSAVRDVRASDGAFRSWPLPGPPSIIAPRQKEPWFALGSQPSIATLRPA